MEKREKQKGKKGRGSEKKEKKEENKGGGRRHEEKDGKNKMTKWGDFKVSGTNPALVHLAYAHEEQALY